MKFYWICDILRYEIDHQKNFCNLQKGSMPSITYEKLPNWKYTFRLLENTIIYYKKILKQRL